MKTPIQKKTEALLAGAFKKLPQRLACPRCGKSRTKDRFGLRVLKWDEQGLLAAIHRQSYCKDCRA